MTYEAAFECCLKKAKLHYEKLSESMIVQFESFEGDYYRNCCDNNEDLVNSIAGWNVSMVTGLATLAMETVQDPDAFEWVNSFKDKYHEKVFADNAHDTHDLGYMYLPYSVQLWQITGDSFHRETALRAAEVLVKRFNVVGRFIEPWKEMNDVGERIEIISVSTVTNMSLLYWAWQETGHRFYLDVANANINTAIKTLVREDYSVAHARYFDTINGEFLEEAEMNGLEKGSDYVRGATCLVFGLAMAYSYTQNETFMDVALKVGEWYLKCLGDRLIPAWSFNLPSEMPAKYLADGNMVSPWDEKDPANAIYNVDTAAASVMCCAFMMLHNMKPNSVFSEYADKTLLYIAEHYLETDMQKMAMVSHASGRNTYSIFGDYFFAYALAMKLYGITVPWGNETVSGKRRCSDKNKFSIYDQSVSPIVSENTVPSAKIDIVLAYIDNHLDKELNVTELSAVFHFHPVYFIRFFKSHTGTTPAHYVKKKKMEIVKQYLENSDLSILEIMVKIGENDVSSFSKKFKSYFSVSPREYRKAYKEKN